MITTTLSSKNQITIPKYILEMLDIKSGDKLLVNPKTEEITITPLKESIVEQLAGSIKVPKNKRGIPFKKIREETQKMVAYDIAHT